MMGRQTGMLRWAGKWLASQGGTFLLISRMLLSPTGNFRSARGLLGLPTGMLQGKGELVQAQTGRAGNSASAKGGANVAGRLFGWFFARFGGNFAGKPFAQFVERVIERRRFSGGFGQGIYGQGGGIGFAVDDDRSVFKLFPQLG